MELTVANDFQNNFDQATNNSFISHLADTLSGRNIYAKAKNENNSAYSKKIMLNSSKVLKKFGTLSCIIRPYEHYDSVVLFQYFYGEY